MSTMPSDDDVARHLIRQAQLAEQFAKSNFADPTPTRTIISSSMFTIWDRWLQQDQKTYAMTDGKPHLMRIWGSETIVVLSDDYFSYSYPIPSEGVGIK